MSRIIIFGDICPTKDTVTKFVNGDLCGIFNEVLEDLRKADVVIGNLECALTDNPVPIQKAGPILYAPTRAAETLKEAYFSILNLANNHIRDCGTDGLISTLSICASMGIETLGAGLSTEAARTPIIRTIGGTKVAFMSFAEHEFNSIEENRPGAYCFDPYDDLDRIRMTKDSVDFLVILYHGGIEYYTYPSPFLQKKCRKFVECGADLVSCQHSHCIGSIEKYLSGTIVYGQGNSIFGYRPKDNSWNTGLMLIVDITNGNKITISTKVITMHEDGVHYAENEYKSAVLDSIEERSSHVQDYKFIKSNWEKFCLSTMPLNIPLLLGWPHGLIFLNRKLRNLPVNVLYRVKKRNVTNNLIRCESHQEVIRTILDYYNYR